MLFQSCLFVLTTFCLAIVSGQAPSNQQEKGENPPGGEDQQQAKVDDLNAINCTPSTQESVDQRRCCLKHPFAGQDWNVCIDLRYIAAAMSNSSDNNTGTFGVRVTVNDKLAINQVLALDDEQEQCYEFEAPQLQSHCVQLHNLKNLADDKLSICVAFTSGNVLYAGAENRHELGCMTFRKN